MKRIAFFSLTMAFLIQALPLSRMLNYVVLVVFIMLDLYLISYKKRVYYKQYGLWFLSFLSICTLSLFWTISFKYSFFIIHSSLLPLGALSLFIVLYSETYKEMKIVLMSFYVSSIVFLVYIFFIIDISLLNDTRIGTAIVDEEIAEKMNSNYIAGRFAIALYAGFYLIYKLNKTNGKIKTIFVGISLVMLYVILVSGSRTSLGIVVLPIFFYYLKNSKNIFKTILGIIVVPVVGYFLLMKVPQFYEIIGSRVEDAVNVIIGKETGYEDTSRIALAELGLEWFANSPLYGVGINCFRVLSDKTSHFGGRAIYAHNNYVELLVDVGLLGLIFYYSAHYYLIKKYRQLRNRENGIGILSLLAVIFFSDIFWVAYLNSLSQFILCITFSMVNIEKRQLVLEIIKVNNLKHETGRYNKARRH